MSKRSKGKKGRRKNQYTGQTKKSTPKNMQHPTSRQNNRKPLDFNKPVTLVFNATDTLFFRESRPMESMGELQSVFPPPVRTLAGAVRTLIGEQKNVDWQAFHEAKGGDPVSKFIGYGEGLGALSFQGAWLRFKRHDDDQRLYPAPLLLMEKEKNLYRLSLDETPVWCDLGQKVRLPALPKDKNAAGSKPLENAWLTQAELEAVLQGGTPNEADIRRASTLFERESRVGIARDNSRRTVEEGLLYQTQHIRPCKALSIELIASGLPDDFPQTPHIMRLGGEGRTASLQAQQEHGVFPKAPKATGDQDLLLYLLTPLQITQDEDKDKSKWRPLPGFVRGKLGQQTVWVGSLHGIELELHGAVTGKVQREGGWDMAKHEPRAVTSLIPAGSAFFCKVKSGDTQAAINALHNKQIGELTAYGYGHLAVGIWKD